MRKKYVIQGLVMVALLVIGTTPFMWGNAEKMYPGISVESENVGGFTRDEWNQFVAQKTKDYGEKEIVLLLGKTKDGWKLKDIHGAVDEEKTENMGNRTNRRCVFRLVYTVGAVNSGKRC